MQLYIRHLFYNVLTRNSSDRVLKLVRKLHWEDPAVSNCCTVPNEDVRLTCLAGTDRPQAAQRVYESVEDQVQQRASLCCAPV